MRPPGHDRSHCTHWAVDSASAKVLLLIGTIPLVKLREFRTKAKMVMCLKATLAPFAPIAGYSISNFVIKRTEDLINEVNQPDITPDMVSSLQEQLAIIQIALDDMSLQRLTLGVLINA